GVVLAVVLLYLVLGCFMEGLAMMVVTMPVLIPALEAVGVDLVWFGVLVVVLLELGLLTPPVGLSLYVIQGISHSDFGTVFKGTMPFFFIHLTGLGLLIAFPPLILWLPSLIFGS
ncbi:MAG: TRAP transporter large permease subunit, partial [Desulfobacteraceae bacterium]|nr:TRAP transporter large permease subunit [Desulfobacteraceae bacterium]